jgi:hypothetical protein
MESKHTPGPWHIGVRQAEQIVYDQKGWAVANATVYHGKEDREEMRANARLMAAAPEMLEALYRAGFALVCWDSEGTLDFFGPIGEAMGSEFGHHPVTGPREALRLIRAAIAKAEGSQA